MNYHEVFDSCLIDSECCVIFVDSAGGLRGGSSETGSADPPQWNGGGHPHLYAWTRGYRGEGCGCCHHLLNHIE